MGHARARKISAQLVEDEDYQLRYERVAGIDVAKAKADVCTRLPPARAAGRRGSRVEEIPATAREVLALAGRCSPTGSSWSSWRQHRITGGSGCDMRSHCLSEITGMEGRLIGS